MDITPAHKLAASRLFLTKEDVDDIIMLVKMLLDVDPMVVDLGAGSGTTALAVLQTNPSAFVTSIDISEDNLMWAVANLVGFGIDTQNYKAILGDASKIPDDLEGVNLLLHDADHSEKAVKKDLHAWLMAPYLYAGALIWVHDYLPMPGAQETYPGVKKVCDDLVERGFLEQIPTTGIGFAARVL